MTENASRVRLHDVHVTGEVADRGELLAAIERAVARTVSGEETRRDPGTVNDAIATDVAGKMSR
jgi:hypothetical protein